MNQQPATSNQQPAADIVLQCGICLRLHDGLSPQANVLAIEDLRNAHGQTGLAVLSRAAREELVMTVSCGRADCATVAKAIWEEQRVRTEAMNKKAWRPIHERRQAKRECRSQKPEGRSQKSEARGQRADFRPPTSGSRMPYPDDDDRVFVNPAQSAAFAAAPEAAKEALLDYDSLTSVLDDFLRVKHYREWFKNTDLLAMLEAATKRRVNNFNNVMSKLRARYEDEQLPLDVDTQALSATVWRVRVCLRSDSFRLQGDNPSRR